jgi:hypothetical protein
VSVPDHETVPPDGTLPLVAPEDKLAKAAAILDVVIVPDAQVAVKPATSMTSYEDAALDRMAVYDMIYRTQVGILKKLYRA